MMKRKTLLVLLVLEAAILVGLGMRIEDPQATLSTLFSFPFEQISGGLGRLAAAESPGVCKGIAVALWVGLSALPLLLALLGKAPMRLAERLALGLLSFVLFIGFYAMINPFKMMNPLGASLDMELQYKAFNYVVGISIWSAILLYAVLRLLRRIQTDEKAALLRDFRALLILMMFLLMAAEIFMGIQSWAKLKQANVEGINQTVGLLRIVVQMIPCVAELVVYFKAVELLNFACEQAREKLVPAAKTLSRVCCGTLIITVASSALFNFLQLILNSKLSNVSVEIMIPYNRLIIIMGLLVIARLLTENKDLQDEAQLFV